ncbi:hypothetical protein TNCV_2945991 [Trichonephila clavipes]|nr:hypothetical protein TNCV_2945991 [Trichonephila clavipes]
MKRSYVQHSPTTVIPCSFENVAKATKTSEMENQNQSIRQSREPDLSDQDDETKGSKNRMPSSHGLTRSTIQLSVGLPFVLQTILRRFAEANM